MKLRLLLFIFLGSSLLNLLLAEPPSYITTPDGVIVFTDPLVTGTPNAVKLEVVADNIIRVIAAPGKQIEPTQSLVTVYAKRPGLSWTVVSAKGSLTLKTRSLTAIVNLKSGVVSFLDLKGKKILSENQPLKDSLPEHGILSSNAEYIWTDSRLINDFVPTSRIRMRAIPRPIRLRRNHRWVTVAYAASHHCE